MRRRFAAATAGVGTLAAAAGIVLAGGVAANAATPPWETTPPAAEVGTIALFNASGVQITHGNVTDDPIAAYAVGSVVPHSGDLKAVLRAAQPNPNKTPDGWNQDALSGNTAYPVSSGPANIQAMGTTRPVVTGGSSDLTLGNFVAEFPNSDTSGPGCAYSTTGPSGCTNASYQNIYQLRIFTYDSGGNVSTSYDAADVIVSNATYDASGNPTSGTWTEVYGSAIGTSVSSLTSSANPVATGSNVTYTAAVATDDASPPSGTVAFQDNGTTITGCGSQTVTSGTATCTTSYSTAGSHPISATFTPTSSGTIYPSYSTSSASMTGNPEVAKQLDVTTTSLSLDGNQTTAGADTVITGAVADTTTSSAHPAGTVNIFDNSSSTPINSSPITVSTTDGSYSFDDTSGFASGNHSVVAQFTPADPSTYAGSSSRAVTFFSSAPAQGACAQTGSQCTDTQTIQGTIPVGTLVISTPYTAAKPLDLGTLALSKDATYWTGSATFQCITVTDTTSGGSPFVASALAQPLSLQGTSSQPGFTSINPENVGLTGLGPSTAACPDGSTPVNSYTKTVTPTGSAAATGVAPSDIGSLGLGGNTAHTVLTGTAGGDGTTTYDGTLTLNAPTSTDAGTYQGTIVFTVSD